jgi:ABC-type molybdenum transport system ATPase subunit/photorepair protein PhrA
MSIVEIKDLDFAYNGETVLENVNLSIRQRDFMAIIGLNGGGKTTLLKLMRYHGHPGCDQPHRLSFRWHRPCRYGGIGLAFYFYQDLLAMSYDE